MCLNTIQCVYIGRFQVTSLPPCWRMITKDSSVVSVVPPTWPPRLCHLILQGLIANHLYITQWNILVPVRTSFGLRGGTMYQRKVDVDMLNALRVCWLTFWALALHQSTSLLWWRANAQNVSQHTLYSIQHIHINLTLTHCIHVIYTTNYACSKELKGTRDVYPLNFFLCPPSWTQTWQQLFVISKKMNW